MECRKKSIKRCQPGMQKGIMTVRSRGSSTQFRGVFGWSSELFKKWTSIWSNMLARVVCQVLFQSGSLLKNYPLNNRSVFHLDSKRLVPLSYFLFLSSPAVRWLPVTTTGYRGWGTSSSRPSMRTSRTLSTPIASPHLGWVSNRNVLHQQHWATQTHKHIIYTIPCDSNFP